MACAAADDFDAALLTLDIDELVQAAAKSRNKNKRQSAAVESPAEPRKASRQRESESVRERVHTSPLFAVAVAVSPESPLCYVCTKPADGDRACEDCDKPRCGSCKLVSTACEACYQGVLAMPPEAESCYGLDGGLCHTCFMKRRSKGKLLLCVCGQPSRQQEWNPVVKARRCALHKCDLRGPFTVKKKGKNEGRSFFNCPQQTEQCRGQSFQWAEEEPKKRAPEEWICRRHNCHLSVGPLVSKNGETHNIGRLYYQCPQKRRNDDCFMAGGMRWADGSEPYGEGSMRLAADFYGVSPIMALFGGGGSIALCPSAQDFADDY